MISLNVLLLAVGQVAMFMWRKTPYCKFLSRHKFFKELFECDLCFGFWVYLILSCAFGYNIFEKNYVIVISEVITSLLSTFIAYVFVAGWKTLFTVIYYGEEK